MKKIYLSLFVLIMSSISLMAQVDREVVLVEIATGTWCGYCPGAAMAAHELMDNGDPVAIVEHHDGDVFETTDSQDMISYYGITGFPTAQFDGEYDEYVGGSATQSMYSNYLPIVNTRIDMQSDFTVEIFGDNTGSNYDIVVRVTEESTFSGGPLTVRFTLTETDIPYTWQNQTTIDYCNRLMVPDADGTTIDFTSGNVQDVNLSFTFDNTWVDSNCELIAWVTDESNKVVQQTTSVMLLDLEPDVANANFTVEDATPCLGSPVQFTDLSSGSITTWNWTFEGGTPATSTDQNPIVTYDTQGVYDVTLYVSDGTTNSTLTMENMIDVMVPPVQPNTPVGDTEACSHTVYTYTTDEVPYADSYIWDVSPSDAGSITGTGIEGEFTPNLGWTGAYTISVRADNDCGIGTWSQALACNMNLTPEGFMLSEGGGMCDGSQGIEITQDGSELDVNYELYLEGATTGNIVAGTGNPISFGNQTQEGTYIVMGVASMCDAQMFGTPWLYYIDEPQQPDPPAGESVVCNDATSNYAVSIVDYADTIYWDLQPVEAGTVIGGYFEADIEWSEDFSGMATLTAQGANECGTGPVSDATEIVVEDTPAPEITGLSTVCDYQSAEYSVTEVAENTYEWTVTGGEITAGAGSATIIVLWGEPGMGTVQLIETTPNDCSGNSGEYEIVIDDCTGMNEDIALNELKVYPNPASSDITIEFNSGSQSKYTLVVYNSLGQVMTDLTGMTTENNNNIELSIDAYPQGIYIVNLIGQDGNVVRTTFEKTR